MNVEPDALVPKGPQAAHIAELFWFYGAVMLVVCLLVWGFVLVAMFRRQVAAQGGLPDPELDELTAREAGFSSVRVLPAAYERRSSRAVVIATALTVLTLFVLLHRSIAVGNFLGDEAPKGALRVEVVAHRWWWSARYLDDDPSLTFVTANELHLPVGRPVELTLKASDVIHSFWVPNLHGKRDLIPGRTTRLVLQVDEPGTYRGQCAEFCGHAHAQMGILVMAESRERFEAWRALQRTNAKAPSTHEQRRGQEVFLQGPCALCHTISGTTAQSSVGHDLSHLGSRSMLAAAMLPNNRGNLAGWLVNAQHLKPGVSMPNISLPAEDLHALVAYLESLR